MRIYLPMLGTHVRSLVWEEPTCHEAAKPGGHNYWSLCSRAPEPQVSCAWSLCTTMRSLCTTLKNSPYLSQLEKVITQPQRPRAVKNKYINDF